MAKKIIWTKPAHQSRVRILNFWIENNKSNSYSIKLQKLFKEHLKLLLKYPEIGIVSDFENIRILLVRDYNIYYTIEDDDILILAIRDARQNPKDFKL